MDKISGKKISGEGGIGNVNDALRLGLIPSEGGFGKVNDALRLGFGALSITKTETLTVVDANERLLKVM